MALLTSGISDFFGLDIGTTAVRLVQLGGRDQIKALQRYAYVPVDSKLALSDSKADQQALAQIVKGLVEKSGVTTKNVAVGIPSQRVFTAVFDIERLSTEELGKSIQYQADSLIPTPLAESKIDWQQLGDSPADKTKVEVLISSVPNSYVEERLDMLEAIGLNVIAFEPDSMSLTRAVVAADATTPQLVIDVGHTATDLVAVMGGAPRLTRAIPTGYEAIVRAAMQNLNIDEAQAKQFINKFGLNQQKLEGQVYHAISGTIDLLMGEIEKSIKFFSTRYAGLKLDRIIITGAAAAIPEFPVYVANRFGVNVEIGNAWRNVSFPATKQNELLTISSQFGVAVGLAERQE
ncbi:MAG TPA: type IV pilus assembly protein PilM [Candidatus Saccharimonadales bacterium]|nr:type IV pilus assembly protein PilM [Candidatus Saccharimonadales bacterium]